MGTISYRWTPALPHAFRRGRQVAVQTILLHSSCGHEDADLITLSGRDAGHLVSSHWYVDKQGRYFHLVDDGDTAYHAGEVCAPKYANAASIGIEQEHLDGAEEWPDGQVRATARLCAALEQRYGNRLEIAHHAQAASPPGRKIDPVDYPSGLFWAAYTEASRQRWEFAAEAA